MSDFVTRLAQRQLGQIASVAPRLPEMFAPSAPVAAPAPMASVEEIPGAAAARRQNDSPPRSTMGAVAQPDSFARAADLTAKPDRVDRVRGSAAARYPEKQITEAPLAGSALNTESFEFSPVVAPRTISTHSGERPLARPSFSERSDVSRSPGATPPLPARLVRDQPAQLIMAAASAPASITAPARLEPQRKDRSVDVGAASAVAEAPIQVTIGRIEVTALTQAAAPKRVSAPRKPAMSLDDYLARRQGRQS